MEKITALMQAYDSLTKTQSPKFLTGLVTQLPAVEATKVAFNRAEPTKLVATDVALGTIGTARSKESYTVTELTPPLYSPHSTVSAVDMYDSLLDENKYSISRSGLQRSLIAIAREQLKNKLEIDRAVEKQVGEVLQTGTISLATQIDGKSTIDYSMPAAGKITPSTRWNASGADILADLEAACQHIQRSGSVTPSILIVGRLAWNALRNNDVFQKRLNEIHSLETSLVYRKNPDTSAVYHGTIVAGSYQLEIWSYTDTYQLANGTHTPYINDKRAVILSMDNDINVAYAGVPALSELDPQQRELSGLTAVGVTVARQSIPFYSIDSLGSSVTAGVRSRPLVIARNISSFSSIDAIA